jgi:hypothetical protein
METTNRSDGSLLTWRENDASSQNEALSAYASQGETGGHIHQSRADRAFIGVTPTTSIRSSFNRSDYNGYRPSETIPTRQPPYVHGCLREGRNHSECN